MADDETEWLDRLVDERPSQEAVLAEADELAQRRKLVEPPVLPPAEKKAKDCLRPTETRG
jgi:hypothetical protein